MILNNYQKYFSQSGFSSKVLSLAKRAGGKLLYPAFVLYTAYKSNEVSIKDKAIIIGALGYFILPKDLISDFLLFFLRIFLVEKIHTIADFFSTIIN